MTVKIDFTHYSRNTPWGGDTGAGEIVVVGRDWSLATFVWSFVAVKGDSPVITLGNALAGSQGVSAVWDPGYLHPQTQQAVGATYIRPLILEATLEGLGWPAPLQAKILHHDLLITPPGQLQRAYCRGTLTIEIGVGD